MLFICDKTVAVSMIIFLAAAVVYYAGITAARLPLKTAGGHLEKAAVVNGCERGSGCSSKRLIRVFSPLNIGQKKQH